MPRLLAYANLTACKPPENDWPNSFPSTESQSSLYERKGHRSLSRRHNGETSVVGKESFRDPVAGVPETANSARLANLISFLLEGVATSGPRGVQWAGEP